MSIGRATLQSLLLITFIKYWSMNALALHIYIVYRNIVTNGKLLDCGEPSELFANDYMSAIQVIFGNTTCLWSVIWTM